MSSKLVSIITPTYNCADFIVGTIESVQNQSYSNWELLITDDCSTDKTRVVAEAYAKKDTRIKLFKLPQNSGAAVARNKSIQEAKGEIIAFLDSDDLWDPLKLEKQLNFMQDNNYSFTFTAYQHISEDGILLDKIIKAKNKINYNDVLLSCPIGNSTVMYHVEETEKFFVPDIRKRNDDALWLKMLKNIPFAYGLDEVLMKYRVRENSLSSNKIELIKYHWYLYRKIENLSFIRSLFHIFYWGFLKIFKIK